MKKVVSLVALFTVMCLTIPTMIYKGKFAFLPADEQWVLYICSSLAGLASSAIAIFLYSQEKEN